MAHTAFEKLAAPLREALWRMGWTALRPIQEQAIEAILGADGDVIISARTAAGKTEAAFLPILSQLVERPSTTIGAVYVSPLKALINDQFRRLEELCEHAQLPVHRWHGDVGAAAKKRLVERPGGILLITPESLESLFINRSTALARIFGDLRCLVIDELHAFVGRERGLHLRSLIYRLVQRIERDFRLVALSATLGDWASSYARWLRPDEPDRVTVLEDTGDEKEIRLRIYGYHLAGGPDDGHEGRSDPTPALAPTLDEIIRAFTGRKGLIFGDSKSFLEDFADSLARRCQRTKMPNPFLVHHGSLSKEIREDAEIAMRGDVPRTTICSSTLELGIDIGNVAVVGQLGAPSSVNSQIQRLGRSGRSEGEAAELRVFIGDYPFDERADLIDRLRPKLLQAIAVTELMLQRWLEPPQLDRFDLSTLCHQIMSALAQTGGMRAQALYGSLAANGAFRYVSSKQFSDLLRELGRLEIVEQMAEGDLILAPEGERIVRRYDFYTAFAAPTDFQVLFDGRSIGSLPESLLPPVGEHVILAGRRWLVLEIDTRREEVLVKPSEGRRPPGFIPSGREIHNRIAQEMREIVCGDRPIHYLDRHASRWLADARAAARQARLAETCWHVHSDNRTLLFTWTGTRAQQTIVLLARAAGMTVDDFGIGLDFRSSFDELERRMSSLIHSPPSGADLVRHAIYKYQRKYDNLLSEELLNLAYERDAVDVEGALGVLRSALQAARVLRVDRTR